MSTQAKPRKISRTRTNNFRLIHRYIGLVLILPVLLLAITGAALEFTEQLKLGSSGVSYEWVHSSYGVNAPDEQLESGWISQLGEYSFTPNKHFNTASKLHGAWRLQDIFFGFFADELIIASKDLDTPNERSTLPTYRAVGVDEQRMMFVLDTGAGYFISDDLGATWQQQDKIDFQPKWLEARRLQTRPEMKARYGAAVISWERWLQDVHSGRFFGPAGEWIMSFAALAIILLALTGFIVWLTTTRRR